jgi:CubicO group peptidase (beta-lactamase class C family)
MKRLALLAVLLPVLPLPGMAGEPPSPDVQAALTPERQVDALFARWDRPDTPGAVVEVIRDCKVVLRKAYGMADLERSVPMGPDSVFFIGSMTKQFTAFAIHLLAQDGKLALDDDIRRYLPDVPDFGATITIRHLLLHTSGLRDYFNLMLMAGRRLDDVITEDEALNLIRRQRSLNFAPGQEWMYSNTGYLLLARVVQRVAGRPLPEFARERIFEPLGMRHTRFQQDYGRLVPGRALSYLRAASGYEYVAVGESTTGAGGIVSTAADLALWDRNFYDARVGGKELIERMQEAGVLAGGKSTGYASALQIGSYRGARMVQHGGTIGGYRTEMARFPDQRFSVVVLANASDLDATGLGHAVADIYLARELAPKPAAQPAPQRRYEAIAVDPAGLDALVGYYALSPQAGIEFSKEGGQLMAQATGQPKIPVYAYAERAFFARALDAQFTFDAPGKDGIAAGGVLRNAGREQRAVRANRHVPTPEELKRYEGAFYSAELGVLYTVAAAGDGRLVLTHPRGAVTFEAGGSDPFATGSWIGNITYQCDARERCNGLTADNGRVRKLQFTRVSLEPPAALAATASR